MISHDPFPIIYEGTVVSTDLGAEKVTEAEGQRIAIEIIAVEVKDFDSRSLISEFEKALGQYRLYRALLRRNEPERAIFLAVREQVYNTFFQLPAIQAVIGDDEVRIITFDETSEGSAMDKVERYREIIRQVLTDYAQRMSRLTSVQLLPVCDPTHDQYLLVSLGWQNRRREHAIVFHAQLRNGQLFIEEDRTEEGLGKLLAEAGVADEDIRPVWSNPAPDRTEAPLVA